MLSNKLIRFINYFFVLSIVALSGFPFFYMNPLFRPLLLILSFLSLIYYIVTNRKFDKIVFNYIIIFTILVIGQYFVFLFFPINAFFGYCLRILFAYMVIQCCGKRFTSYYVKIILFFSIISLIFYFSTVISHDFERFFTSNVTPFFALSQKPSEFYPITPNIIIFNFNSGLEYPNMLLRNSGPFWEPGAFAGFSIIALIFNIIHTNKLFEKTNNVLIISILTTLSTAGYIALAVVILSYYLQHSKSRFKYIVVPIFCLISYFLYYHLDFLEKKVDTNISTIETSSTSNRFVSALVDIKNLQNHWILGRGFNIETRYSHDDIISGQLHRNNGITAIMSQIGIILTLVYFSFIYLFFRRFCIYYKINRNNAIAFIAIIFIIGFSQGYFTKLFFICLTMLAPIYKLKPTKKFAI